MELQNHTIINVRIGKFIYLHRLRLAARTSLIAIGDKRGIERMWDDFRYERSIDENYPWFAITLLAFWESADVEGVALRKLLQDGAANTRAATAFIVGQHRLGSLAEDVETLLDDHTAISGSIAKYIMHKSSSTETVADVAREALDRISGNREPWTPLPKGTLRNL
ncbi:MAG: hypothetical protein NTW21_02500 [Verrucomicrobia bacterium]|nr:hypothetical protein [Verrucomicrobiota bacterium]